MHGRSQNIHNKTQVISNEELPYNTLNVLIQPEDLRVLFRDNGLGDIEFHNINLYRNAFVHRSYITMKNDDFESGNERCPTGCLPLQEMSYERLEFLGDAILGMVVARYLYERFPDQSEGFLSKMRTKIVNGRMLGFLSEKIGFPKYVIISKQIEESQGRTNFKIMEDVFEAFIGAIYMDFQTYDDDIKLPSSVPFDPLSGSGFHVTEQWIVNIIETYIDFPELIQSKNNFKDMLVRHMQHHNQDSPKFFEVNVVAKNNGKVFTYCVKDRGGAVLGTASAPSKKEAENLAAKAALTYYGVSLS